MVNPHRPALVINCTFKGIALGVFQPAGDEARSHAQLFIAQSHSAALKLPALVREVLGSAQLDWQDLAGVAVAHGPGSFTGIKIGLSFVQGLAAAGQPKLPILGLDAMACLVRYGRLGNQPWILPQNRRKGYLYRSAADPQCVWLAPELGLTPLDAQLPDDPRRQPWPKDIDKVGLITPWQELKAALPATVAAEDADGEALGYDTLAAMAIAFSRQQDGGQQQLVANYVTPSTPEERKLADQQRQRNERKAEEGNCSDSK